MPTTPLFEISGEPFHQLYTRSIADALSGAGLLASGDFKVTATATNNEIQIAAGTLWYEQAEHSLGSATTKTLSSSDASNDRWDTVAFDASTDSVTVKTGTAESNPEPPDVSGDEFALAAVYVAAGSTDVGDDGIVNIRPEAQDAAETRYAGSPSAYSGPLTVASALDDLQEAVQIGSYPLTSADIDETDSYDLSSGGFVFPTGTSPSQTTEGKAVWDSDDDLLKVGTSGSTVTVGKDVAIRDDGTQIVSDVSTLNFAGSDFDVTNTSGSAVDASISTDAVSSDELDTTDTYTWTNTHTFNTTPTMGNGIDVEDADITFTNGYIGFENVYDATWRSPDYPSGDSWYSWADTGGVNTDGDEAFNFEYIDNDGSDTTYYRADRSDTEFQFGVGINASGNDITQLGSLSGSNMRVDISDPVDFENNFVDRISNLRLKNADFPASDDWSFDSDAGATNTDGDEGLDVHYNDGSNKDRYLRFDRSNAEVQFGNAANASGNDITDSGTTVWDSANSEVPQSQLGGPPASISAHPLANSDLANSQVTYNGVSASLGGTATLALRDLRVTTSVSSATTTNGEDTVFVDPSGTGGVTITLASADATAGAEVVVQDVGGTASGNTVTVDTEGSETFADGDSAKTITADRGWLTARWDGSNWVSDRDAEFASITTDDLDIDGLDLAASGDFLPIGPFLTQDETESTTSTSYVSGRVQFRFAWDDLFPWGSQIGYRGVMAIQGGSSTGDVRLRNTADSETVHEETDITSATRISGSYTPTTTGSLIGMELQYRTNDGGTVSTLGKSNDIQWGVEL